MVTSQRPVAASPTAPRAARTSAMGEIADGPSTPREQAASTNSSGAARTRTTEPDMSISTSQWQGGQGRITVAAESFSSPP